MKKETPKNKQPGEEKNERTLTFKLVMHEEGMRVECTINGLNTLEAYASIPIFEEEVKNSIRERKMQAVGEELIKEATKGKSVYAKLENLISTLGGV